MMDTSRDYIRLQPLGMLRFHTENCLFASRIYTSGVSIPIGSKKHKSHVI